MAQYFYKNLEVPRRFIVQYDGVNVCQRVVWTKSNQFFGFVDSHDSIAHYLTGEAKHQIVEYAYTVEVFMCSVVHSGIQNIVRAAHCGASMTFLDYWQVLDDLLESLDCDSMIPDEF